MASTRISNDRLRIYKNLQQSTDVGRHVINVPGNGLDVPFVEDPHIRMQYWGANRMNDIISVENSLKNIDRPLIRETTQCKESYYTKPDISRMDYSNATFEVNDSFISQPAWNLRDKESDRDLGYCDEPNNAHIFIPFNTNLGTRIHEKDLFCKSDN
jgi:hypothetical protein